MMHRRGGGKFRGGHRNFQANERFQSDHDNFNERSNFNEHRGNFNDRGSFNDRGGFKTSEIKRRVSFKTVRNHKVVNDMKVKAFLDDEDMVGELTQAEGSHQPRLSGDFKRGGGNFRNRRNGSPLPRHVGGGGKLLQNPNGWYIVTIEHGAKYDKDIIFKLLLNAVSPTIFIPNYFKVDPENNSCSFYVDEHEIAEKILRMSRKLELPDGFKMLLRVRGSVPQTKIDESLKQRMKIAMVKRYNQATNALDLSKFHADPELTDIFCALFRPPIMSAAIDIIAENIPNLEALNLNDNKLNLLDHMKMMSSKLPNIKILYLGNNRIFMMNSLDAFRGLPLVELFLEGNPCKKRIRDHSQYVSEIKKRFPKLVKLDGSDLGPTIGFDVTDEPLLSHLPTWKPAFLCNQAGSELIQKFLEQYFMLYDSDNRQQLLEAYHDQAMFSITATNNQHYSPEEKLHNYWKVARNLAHPRGMEQRMHLLKKGKLSVVALITDLPPTRHDPQSFVVDLTVFTPQMIVLTVTGLFKERNPNAEYSRTFHKTMVIVPNNNGFCIINDLMHINNASQNQARNAFKTPTIAAPQMSAPQMPAALPPSTQLPGAPDEATKMQMIQAMSQQSNMNIEWSRKCLEETSWDFQRAGFVFSELFKQNKIPPEAFSK